MWIKNNITAKIIKLTLLTTICIVSLSFSSLANTNYYAGGEPGVQMGMQVEGQLAYSRGSRYYDEFKLSDNTLLKNQWLCSVSDTYFNDYDISWYYFDKNGRTLKRWQTINGKTIPGTEEDYSCDTLLLSVGLIPENELSGGMGVAMNRVTSGPRVNESLETSVEGVFACGNVLHVHDLVDFVSEEAAAAGRHAASYIKEGRKENAREIVINAVEGVRYTVPCTISPERMEDTQVVRFRVGNVYKNCCIGVYFDGEQVIRRKRPVMAPGEMEEIRLEKEKLLLHPELKTITIKVEEA